MARIPSLRNLPALPWGAGMTLLAVAGSVLACTVPVFRYALDRWEPDGFLLKLNSETARTEATRSLLRPFRANGGANLEIAETSLDLGSEAVLFFPGRTDKPVWTGPFTGETWERLLRSPGRETIAGHLLEGASAVFVLADEGTSADDLEAARIGKRLRFLESVARIPEIDPTDPSNRMGPGPELKIGFPLVRLRKSDPVESVFLDTLRGPEWYGNPSDGPFLGVVFGRGRVLDARPVSECDDEWIENTALFLVGACSCQVKNQNPGWDSLFAVDWDRALAAAGEKAAANQASQDENATATATATAPASAGEPPVAGAPETPAEAAVKPPASPGATVGEAPVVVKSQPAAAAPQGSHGVAPAAPGNLPLRIALLAGAVFIAALSFRLLRR